MNKFEKKITFFHCSIKHIIGGIGILKHIGFNLFAMWTANGRGQFTWTGRVTVNINHRLGLNRHGRAETRSLCNALRGVASLKGADGEWRERDTLTAVRDINCIASSRLGNISDSTF